MRTDILDRKDDILVWIHEKKPKSYICKQLKCKPSTLNVYLDRLGISYSGNQGVNLGERRTRYKNVEQYLKNSYISAHKLRIKLIRDGIKKHECEICKINEWMGKPVPLELDHIDGNHFNNDMDNLRIICPNCHSQTETNSGKKNKKRM